MNARQKMNLREPVPDTMKPEELKDKLNIKKVLRYIEHEHDMHSIQLEKLDDDISTLTLYKLVEKPLDITNFKNEFRKGYGVNPMRDMKKSNFHLKRNEFVALISNNHHDINAINEHIEPWVINL